MDPGLFSHSLARVQSMEGLTGLCFAYGIGRFFR